MAYISEEEINNIREKANIVDIISSYVPLNKAGSDYVGICPFHDDHSPSMHVSTKLNLYKCFVCGSGGNVFSFVKNYENVNYVEAIKIVADKCGIPFNHNIDANHESIHKKEFDMMMMSLKYYQNNINSKSGVEAKKYLLNRGINDDIINEFKMGLSLGDNSLKKVFDTKKLDLEMGYNIGLLNKQGIDYYDMFSNRIMIPLIDMQGNLAGYTARAYLTDEKNKYINSKESIIYHKSDMLFNYYNAKNEARLNKEIIVVEGNMDAISLACSGIKNVVALMGVVISKKQIDYLKKLNARVVLILDNDNAGLIATMNVGDELLSAGLDTYVVRLSGAKDPDEYIRKYSKKSLLDNIKHARKYLDFKIDALKEKYDLTSTLGKAEYVKEVINTIKDVSDIEKDVIISTLSNEYNIDIELLKKSTASKPKEVIKNQNVIKKKKSRYEMAASNLIYALLLNKEYIKVFNTKIGYLHNKIERDVISMISMYIKKKGDINISGFMDYIEKYPEITEFVSKVISENHQESIEKNEFYDILNTCFKCMNEEEIKELKEQIKNEQDVNKKLELMNKLTELKKGSELNEGN